MAWASVAKKLAYQRAWDRRRIARWRQHGCCVRCGVQAGLNAHTGRPFWHCFDHRRSATQFGERYRQARRARSARP